MKNYLNKTLQLAAGVLAFLPLPLMAQDAKDKKDKEKKESEEIVIIRKGDKKEKVTVEVDGDKITVNGKPLDEYKGDDVTIRKGRIRDAFGFSFGNGMGTTDLARFESEDSNRAMLGVTTESADGGVEIQSITRESGAAKAGLKKGDIIQKIDDKRIEDPDDLSEAVRAHKPGDKVSVAYRRDGKDLKVTAELGRWKTQVFATVPDLKFREFNMDQMMPRALTIPRNGAPFGQYYSWSGDSPRLGLSVQDTDEGKGVKVVEVDDESNAGKAGIKEDDIITEVEGKAVNSADEVAKIVKESKEKRSIMVKLTRDGKVQNIELRMPRKLKTADL